MDTNFAVVLLFTAAFNKTGYVRVTLRRVRATIVAMEKQ